MNSNEIINIWDTIDEGFCPIYHFLKYHNNDKYDYFILGMSHSASGVLEKYLPGRVYKFSVSSMDLYYHRMVLKILKERYCYFGEIKKIYLELPYYIFNYDVSKCRKVMPIRINHYYFFNQYHNFDDKDTIALFVKYNTLRKKPFPNILCIDDLDSNDNSEKENRKSIISAYSAVKELHFWKQKEINEIDVIDRYIWSKKFVKTVEENICIWNDIKSILKENEIDYEIWVFPHLKYFIKRHLNDINEKKKEFYLVLQGEKIKDWYLWGWNKSCLFSDEYHLNTPGAFIFTEVVRKYIKRDIYGG